MKTSSILLAAIFAASVVKADLTLTQQIQREGGLADTNGAITLKLKGDMIRVDVSPQISTILNGKTGEITTLMHAQKMSMSISSATLKSMTSQIKGMVSSTSGTNSIGGSAPTPTGNRQNINGFDCEEYTSTTGELKVTYWIAKDFPDKELLQEASAQFAGIVPQLSALKEANPGASKLPGYPIRTVIESPTLGKTTITLAGLNNDPLPDNDL